MATNTTQKAPFPKPLPWRKLPMETLVEEILPRLPAKSLVRFKCVSKYFQTLISTPEFIHRHLRHSLSSSSADRHLTLIAKLNAVYSVHLDSPELSPVSLPISDAGLFVVGTCNGLVCMGTSRSSLVIFNPSIGIFREIICNDLDDFAGSYIDYGFGYDSSKDDYKIVSITTSYSLELVFGMWTEVEVYSLKSGSWNLVERTCSQESVTRKGYGVLVENHLDLVHWILSRSENGEFSFATDDIEYRIGCFDLCNNRWGDDVPLPDYSDEIWCTRSRLVDLGVLDGCLCLLTDSIESIGKDVWVMKEYGVRDSWVKLVSISRMDVCHSVEICPFAYARGSRTEILIRMDSKSKLFWYNIRDKTCRPAQIYGVPDYAGVCISNGSLVSIPGGVRFLLRESKS